MTGDKTRRALVALLAALVLVIGGAVAASGQIGPLRGQVTSAPPSDGPSTDDATDDPTDESTDSTDEESTDEESTDPESTDEESTDEAGDTTDKESDGGKQGAAASREPCTLKSPPNRAATSDTDPARHPGWSTGKHFGWCRAAAHGRPTTSDDGAVEKRPGTPARPGATERTKPHPGKRLAKGHGKPR